MSNIAISGASTGTATFTLESPATSTNRTLTLPDETGTILTNATTTGFPAGSVLQVVQGALTSGFSSTSSTSFVATSLSASITPSSATSKILILSTFTIYQTAGGGGSQYSVFRGSTDIAGTQVENEVKGLWLPGSINYLDSPATTSSTTYTLYYKTTNASYAALFGGNSGTRNTIILMEVAA
jgi:hypothetical protein